MIKVQLMAFVIGTWTCHVGLSTSLCPSSAISIWNYHFSLHIPSFLIINHSWAELHQYSNKWRSH